jgi:hypothetical protein
MQGDPETCDPMGQGGEWVLQPFCIAWWWRCLSDANGHFLGRWSVSLTTYHLLGPPAVHPLVLQYWSDTDKMQSVLILTPGASGRSLRWRCPFTSLFLLQTPTTNGILGLPTLYPDQIQIWWCLCLPSQIH